MDAQEAAELMQRHVWPLLIEYIPRALGFLLALFVARLVAGWLSGLVSRALVRANVDEALRKFLENLVRWGALAVGVITALGYVGVETASFAAVIAASGLAIGLAFQGSLSNFAAGVMLLIFRPFRVGDYINAAGVAGTVVSIEVFTTELKTPDAQRIIVPNSAIFSGTITNVTHHPQRRVDVAVGTDYSADLTKVREVLASVPPKLQAVLQDPAPQIFLAELGGSSIDWQVRVWVNGADFWDVRQELTQRVKEALDEAGIGIPFPQRDVHLDPALIDAIAKR